MLPALYSVPVRAVSIHPSNLIPLSSGNITFEYNQKTFVNYQFYVVQIKYGIIQLQMGNGQSEWKQTDSFSGLQVLEQNVRYSGLVAQPESIHTLFTDSIHITCFRKSAVSNVLRLVLPVHFIRIHMNIVVSKPLSIQISTISDEINPQLTGVESRASRLDTRYLKVKVEPQEKDSLIWFTLTKTPKHGHLFLVSRENGDYRQKHTTKESDEKIYLGTGSQFTQKDLKEGNLFYVFRRVLDENTVQLAKINSKGFDLTDKFKYRIHVEGAQPRRIYDFSIIISQISGTLSVSNVKFTPTITNKDGYVEEGDDLLLTRELFYAQHPQCKNHSSRELSDEMFQEYDLYFQILSPPEHGLLLIKSPYNSSTTDIVSFAEYNLKLIDYNLLIYRHNDEEEFQDSFHFQFLCRQTPTFLSGNKDDMNSLLTGLTHASIKEQFGQPVTSIFRINVIPVNDNPPSLTILPLLVEFNKTNNTLDKSIKVLDYDKVLPDEYYNNNPNKSVLEKGDFCIFWEEVKQFQRKDISYPNIGYFVHNLEGDIRYQFRYSELTSGFISFQHTGFPTGQINIKVTDGKFTTSKLLPVNVTRPSFLVLQPNILLLGPSGRVFIPIEVVSNVNLNPDNIYVSVIRFGCFGNLMLFGLKSQASNWTYKDLLQYPLYYEYKAKRAKLGNYNDSSRNGTYIVYCHLLHSANAVHEKVDDWIVTRFDEINLFVRTLYAGRMLQQEVKLSISLNQMDQWNKTHNDGDVILSVDDIIVEKGQATVIKLKNYTKGDNFQDPSQLLIIVNQMPRYGVLHLFTTSFNISPIKYFTLADLIAERILYEPLTNKLDSMKAEYRKSLLARDYIKVSVNSNEIEYMVNNEKAEQPKEESQTRLQQVISISIVQKGLNLQHFNLAMEPKTFRSLTDSKLTPIINNENPVRHDEPFRQKKILVRPQMQLSTENEMTRQPENTLKMDFSYIQSHHSKNKNIYYNKDSAKCAKILFTIRSGPKYGSIISNKLNRTIRLFSDLDLAANDIFYHNFGNRSAYEDQVELTALELTTEMLTINPVKIKFMLNEKFPRPYLVTCLPMRILTGSSIVITTHYMNAALTSGFQSDHIMYEILYTHQGHISLLNSLHVSVSTFSQLDLHKGRVAFVHSGLHKSKTCGFSFVLTYKLYRSEIYHFQLIPGVAELNIISNNRLLMFPIGYEIITPHHINVQIKFTAATIIDHETTSKIRKECEPSSNSSALSKSSQYDFDNDLGLHVVYKVLSQPRHGIIIKLSDTKGDSSENRNDGISEFTQDDIKAGRIAYLFHSEKWIEGKKNLAFLKHTSDIDDEYIVCANIVRRNIPEKIQEDNNYFKNIYSTVKLNNSQSITGVINYHDYTKQISSHILFGSVSISYNYVFKYNRNRILNIYPLMVYNGQVGEITVNHINTDQIKELLEINSTEIKSFKIVKEVKHGSLWFGSKLVKAGSVIPGLFSGVLSEKLTYHHDGSSSNADSFELLINQLKRSLTDYEQPVIFPIQILPRISAPLRLINPTPRSMHNNLRRTSENIIVVKTNSYVTITNEHLFVDHAFIQPQFIYIHFKMLPKYGKLYYSYNSFNQEHDALIPECETIHKITQYDINLKRLRYYANHAVGLKNKDNNQGVLRDSVVFEVYQKEYPNLSVNHLTGSLEFQLIFGNLTLNNSIYFSLLQNETKLWLDTSMINVELSEHSYYQKYDYNQQMYFIIRQLPKYGKIYVDTIPVQYFSYQQLQEKRVYYEKTNLSTANDSFIIKMENNLCGAAVRSRLIYFHQNVDYKQNFSVQSVNFDAHHLTFSIYITVKSLAYIDTLYVTPGKISKINPASLKLKEFEKFIQKHNVAAVSPHLQNSLESSIFTFPTGAVLKSGRFYINDRLVISSGYLNDEPSSSIDISLKDFQLNSVSFEAYKVSSDRLGIYEEIIPYIFTVGTSVSSMNYLTPPALKFIQPGFGVLKISMTNTSFSLWSNNSLNNNSRNHSSVFSPSLSSVNEFEKFGENDKYLGTGKIAFTVAGLALSIAFISVLIICTIGCCIYKCKNKAVKRTINVLESPEKCAPSSLPLTTPLSNGESKEGSNSYILKRNHGFLNKHLSVINNKDEKFDTIQWTNSPVLSVKSSKVTFNKSIKIAPGFPAELPSTSTLDYACSCDFSGAVIYCTGDMQTANDLPPCIRQIGTKLLSSASSDADSVLHLTSPTNILPSQAQIIQIPSSLCSRFLQNQQHPSQLINSIILTPMPTTSLDFHSTTILAQHETVKEVSLDIENAVPLPPFNSHGNDFSKDKCTVVSEKQNLKDDNKRMNNYLEITDCENIRKHDINTDLICIDTLPDKSQKHSETNESITCFLTNVYDEDFT
ncbi:unnamed protein product [Trichobilharzia szidati]|nr:unnamed protein product [Trichobilharzia szidati]